MEKFKEIFQKAFKIGNEVRFRVRFLEGDKVLNEMSLTYIQLGAYLVGRAKEIETVDVRRNPE